MLIGQTFDILEYWLLGRITFNQLLPSIRIKTVESFDWTANFSLGRRREEIFKSIYERVWWCFRRLIEILDWLKFHDCWLGKFISPFLLLHSLVLHSLICLDSIIIIKIKKENSANALNFRRLPSKRKGKKVILFLGHIPLLKYCLLWWYNRKNRQSLMLFDISLWVKYE